MSESEIELSGSPERALSVRNDPQLRALSRKLFLISMAGAAIPVVMALGIMSDSQPELTTPPAHADPGKGANTAPRMVAAAPASDDIVDVAARAEQSRSEAEAERRGPQSPWLATSELRTEQPASEIRLAGLESIADFQTVAAVSLANPDSAVVRLETPPAQESALQQILLQGFGQNPILTSFRSDDADNSLTVNSDQDTHATVASATQAKRIRPEIKSHVIAHHRHRPQRHEPPTLFAKIGRSVKEAWMNAVTFARGGKERSLWD